MARDVIGRVVIGLGVFLLSIVVGALVLFGIGLAWDWAFVYSAMLHARWIQFRKRVQR